MVWDSSLPAGADKIKDSDNNIRANNDAIETVLGTNLTVGPTTIQDAILGDGTKGRQLRGSVLKIDDGTNASTLKCTLTNRWNGDVIAETDNVAKDATTGDFTLNAAGTVLTVEATGLTGNCVYCIANLWRNPIADLEADASPISNDIYKDNDFLFCI